MSKTHWRLWLLPSLLQLLPLLSCFTAYFWRSIINTLSKVIHQEHPLAEKNHLQPDSDCPFPLLTLFNSYSWKGPYGTLVMVPAGQCVCVCWGKLQISHIWPYPVPPPQPRGQNLEILPTAQGWGTAMSQAAGKALLSSFNTMQTWKMLFLHLAAAILSKKTPYKVSTRRFPSVSHPFLNGLYW